jgi:hypothetical protein
MNASTPESGDPPLVGGTLNERAGAVLLVLGALGFLALVVVGWAIFAGILSWFIDKSGGFYWVVTFGLGGVLAVVAFIGAFGSLGLFAFILILFGIFGIMSGRWDEGTG